MTDFLNTYPKDKKSEMFKKHGPALTLLSDLVGPKLVTDVRQRDINDYFKVVERLPPRWAEKCKKRGLTPRALAELDHPEVLGPKTFMDNYLVPVRLFLRHAVKNWQDEGFPTTLTTDGTEYGGDREEGESKQRAFTLGELRRLFHGPELTEFRKDPAQAHKWWLPTLGFYTGARVRELCQLNPQTDILCDLASGIDYLLITEDGDADERVTKSVKTKRQRTVPIHPVLIKLGFLEYIEALKQKGSKLIFPAWNPDKEGSASTQAEKYFRTLLEVTGLRDDTAKAKITGMHAFRHTLLTRSSNSQPPVDAGPITGHVNGDKSAVQRGYEGDLSVPNKLKILLSIQFGFEPGRSDRPSAA